MTLLSLPQGALSLKTPIGFSISQRQEIQDICHHIASVGLLNPLVVAKEKGRYVIVDGKKRFQAIKKMTRNKTLPRTLINLPCVVSDNAPGKRLMTGKPLLITEPDLVNGILEAASLGKTPAEIKQQYECSDKVMNQAFSLKNLHSKLHLAFINGIINLDQASAFATLPNPNSQWNLLLKLGPFVTDTDIIAAITDGQTVIELSAGNVLILPSRSRKSLSASTAQNCEPMVSAA